jgi:hypothetical protein
MQHVLPNSGFDNHTGYLSRNEFQGGVLALVETRKLPHCSEPVNHNAPTAIAVCIPTTGLSNMPAHAVMFVQPTVASAVSRLSTALNELRTAHSDDDAAVALHALLPPPLSSR